MRTRRRNYITAFPDGTPGYDDAVRRLRLAVVSGVLDDFTEPLKEIVARDLPKVLAQKYRGSDYRKTTLLIEAALKGHATIVKYILNEFNVDLDAVALDHLHNSKFDSRVTALWCASASGYFEIVKALVDKGANIDCCTSTGSTPLRAAVQIGHNNIVKYLTENGANVNLNGLHTGTNLMVAVHKGHHDIVHDLLINGADVNRQTCSGSTAMHFAVTYNHISIAKKLNEFNAKQLKNNKGLSPILIAADRSEYDFVYHILGSSNFTREERIEIEELLGASYFNNRDKYDTTQGFSILMRAMESRWKEPVIHKKPYKINEAYGNRIECQTVQELHNIKNNRDALNYESLIIRERILGDTNPDLLRPIVYLGSSYWARNNYTPCLKLWSHALKISQKNKRRVSVDILRFLRVFRQMIITNVLIKLSFLKNVLDVARDELKNIQRFLSDSNQTSKKRWKQAEYAEIIKLTLGLITITSIALERNDDFEDPMIKDVMKTIEEIIQLDPRKNDNQTLLHLSLNHCTFVDNENANAIYCFPNYKLMNLLINCGADVNATDNSQNTPLHCIGKFIATFPDLQHANDDMHTKKTVLKLLNAGAHTDYINKNRDCPHTGYLKTLFKFTDKIPKALLCISAQALKYSFSKEYYEDKLPKKLTEFINLH